MKTNYILIVVGVIALILIIANWSNIFRPIKFGRGGVPSVPPSTLKQNEGSGDSMHRLVCVTRNPYTKTCITCQYPNSTIPFHGSSCNGL